MIRVTGVPAWHDTQPAVQPAGPFAGCVCCRPVRRLLSPSVRPPQCSRATRTCYQFCNLATLHLLAHPGRPAVYNKPYKGFDGYRHALFGDTITVERRLSRVGGASSYLLKDQHGRRAVGLALFGALKTNEIGGTLPGADVLIRHAPEGTLVGATSWDWLAAHPGSRAAPVAALSRCAARPSPCPYRPAGSRAASGRTWTPCCRPWALTLPTRWVWAGEGGEGPNSDDWCDAAVGCLAARQGQAGQYP